MQFFFAKVMIRPSNGRMTMNVKKQTVSGNIHESLCVALILALLGGFLDAYTFILKNGVFANAQTGNLILLSVSLFNGEYGRVPQYLLPIVFFSLGILLSEYIKETPLIGQNTKKINNPDAERCRETAGIKASARIKQLPGQSSLLRLLKSLQCSHLRRSFLPYRSVQMPDMRCRECLS